MQIQEWLDSGADYDTGLILYSKQPKHNKNLLRLFMRKNSHINLEKLKYELKKLSVNSLKKGGIAIEIIKGANKHVNKSDELPIVNVSGNTDNKQYRLLRINQLPVELHPLYIKQKNDFATACSLKIQLNDLPAEDETEALEFCLEIERLFDSIEKAWKVFDHYTEFKVVPEMEDKTYDDLSPVLLLKAEKSKREAISKARARIKAWTTELDNTTDKTKRQKLHRQLQKKNEDLMSHELALEKIKELINKK